MINGLILVLLIVIIVLLILNLLKVSKNKEQEIITDEFKTINSQLEKQLVNQSMLTNNHLESMISTLDTKIVNQNMKNASETNEYIKSLNTILNSQNIQNNESIKEVIQKVTKLDAAKDQMLELSQMIKSLEDILKDKKSRGSLGEVQLNSIFSNYFSQSEKMYETQKMLSNGKIVDLVLHAPEPLGDICIDSKFPLESFKQIVSCTDEIEKSKLEKQFVKDIKKHIDDISNKYIIEGETAMQAMMFIPAEGIFSYLINYCEEIIDYSYKKKVWITSPTTLMSILSIIQVVVKDLKRSKQTMLIHEELIKLSKEFDRYQQRWNNLTKHLDTVNKDINEIKITSEKLSKKFTQIEEVDFSDED